MSKSAKIHFRFDDDSLVTLRRMRAAGAALGRMLKDDPENLDLQLAWRCFKRLALSLRAKVEQPEGPHET